ncbi:MAG: 3-deoxy-manno-octulosonate-8-phosphatase KdsC [Nitrospirota bacterium]
MTIEEVRRKASKIKLFISDVDGVLTAGQIILDDNGVEYKVFHVRDGHGIKLLMRAGVEVALITGRRSKVVEVRARELGIEHTIQGALDKLPAYQELKERLGMKDEEVAYIGDDNVDLPVMKRVGLSIAVADAEPYVKEAADMVTERCGGQAAVREAIDFILKARGDWETVNAKYFN